jgi:hypothetical protein
MGSYTQMTKKLAGGEGLWIVTPDDFRTHTHGLRVSESLTAREKGGGCRNGQHKRMISTFWGDRRSAEIYHSTHTRLAEALSLTHTILPLHILVEILRQNHPH